MNQTALICRLQGLNEPVSTYYYDVMRLCFKMNPEMTEEEKLTHLMRGLKSGVLERVLVLEPKNCEDLLNKLRNIEESEILSQRRPGYNYLLVQETKAKQESMSINKTVPRENEQSAGKQETDVEKLCELVRQLLEDKRRPKVTEGKEPYYKPNKQFKATRTVDGRPICHNCGIPGHFAKFCFKGSNYRKPTNTANTFAGKCPRG